MTVDSAGFERAMNRQKEQARAAGKFQMAATLEYAGPATTFHGYDTLDFKGTVLAIYREGSPAKELKEGCLLYTSASTSPPKIDFQSSEWCGGSEMRRPY